MKNMRVYKDGRRLVIVLEDAGAEMEDYVKHMLEGDIQKVEHLAPPPQMAKPKLDLGKMQEIKPEGENMRQAQTQAAQPVNGSAGQAGKPAVQESGTSIVKPAHKQPEIPKKQLPKFMQNTAVEAEACTEPAGKNIVSQTQKVEAAKHEAKLSGSTVRQQEKNHATEDKATERQPLANSKLPKSQEKPDNAKPGFTMEADTFVSRTAGNNSSRPGNVLMRPVSQATPTDTDSQAQPQKQPKSPVDVRIMNIFELKQFLNGKRKDTRLAKLVFDHHHMSLDCFLNVKSEKDIRDIAVKLAM